MASTHEVMARLRAECPGESFPAVLAWWHASEAGSRRRAAERADTHEKAWRAAKKARSAAQKIQSILESDPRDRRMIQGLAVKAKDDADAAESAAKRFVRLIELQVVADDYVVPRVELQVVSDDESPRDEVVIFKRTLTVEAEHIADVA